MRVGLAGAGRREWPVGGAHYAALIHEGELVDRGLGEHGEHMRPREQPHEQLPRDHGKLVACKQKPHLHRRVQHAAVSQAAPGRMQRQQAVDAVLSEDAAWVRPERVCRGTGLTWLEAGKRSAEVAKCARALRGSWWK